jgi:hypothetical protein
MVEPAMAGREAGAIDACTFRGLSRRHLAPPSAVA